MKQLIEEMVEQLMKNAKAKNKVEIKLYDALRHNEEDIYTPVPKYVIENYKKLITFHSEEIEFYKRLRFNLCDFRPWKSLRNSE